MARATGEFKSLRPSAGSGRFDSEQPRVTRRDRRNARPQCRHRSVLATATFGLCSRCEAPRLSSATLLRRRRRGHRRFSHERPNRQPHRNDAIRRYQGSRFGTAGPSDDHQHLARAELAYRGNRDRDDSSIFGPAHRINRLTWQSLGR